MISLKKLLIGISLSFLGMAAIFAKDAPPKNAHSKAKIGQVSRISLDRFYPLHQAGKVQLYDTRITLAYQLSHIPGAIHWSALDYDKKLSQHEPQIKQAIRKGKFVVLYCTNISCENSLIIADRLAKLGHSVAVLEGGFDAWKNADLPTE